MKSTTSILFSPQGLPSYVLLELKFLRVLSCTHCSAISLSQVLLIVFLMFPLPCWSTFSCKKRLVQKVQTISVCTFVLYLYYSQLMIVWFGSKAGFPWKRDWDKALATGSWFGRYPRELWSGVEKREKQGNKAVCCALMNRLPCKQAGPLGDCMIIHPSDYLTQGERRSE